MLWSLNAARVTTETVRAALEAQNPFLKPMGPPDEKWMESITPAQKAQVKLALDAACAVVAEEQRVQLNKIIDVATAATDKMFVAGAQYNISVSGHDGSHIPGVGGRVMIAIDEVVDVPKELQEPPKPEKLLLGEGTPDAGQTGIGNRLA